MTRPTLVRVAAVLAAALSGCGGGVTAGTTTTSQASGPAPTIVTTTPTTAVVTLPRPTDPLVVWVSDPALEAAVTARGDAYASATGVAVEVRIFSPSATAGSDLLEALLGDDLDGAADIYIGPHTWVLPLAEAGLAEPVPIPAGVAGSILGAVSPRGLPLGVPVAVDGVVQARNRALMPEAPAAAESIPCPDIDRCLLLPADGDADLHYPFLVALGGYLFGPDPDLGYDRDDVGVAGEAAIAGVNVFADLLAIGTIDAVADSATALADFAAGGAALVWVRATGLAAVQASGMDIAIEPLPTIGGNPAVTSFRLLTAFVNPFGTAKSEAVEFASRWLGDAGGSSVIALAAGMAPVWPESAAGATAVVLAAATAGHPVPPIEDIDRIWFELADAFRRIHAGTPVTDAMFGAHDDIG